MRKGAELTNENEVANSIRLAAAKEVHDAAALGTLLDAEEG